MTIKILDGDKSFGVAGKLVYTEIPDQNCNHCPADMHTMLIIGMRWEGESRRFLVQNWWTDHQFVELDQNFLEKCAALAYFVFLPQYEILKGLPQTRALYDEV